MLYADQKYHPNERAILLTSDSFLIVAKLFTSILLLLRQLGFPEVVGHIFIDIWKD
jgi:hypothetical protein